MSINVVFFSGGPYFLVQIDGSPAYA